MNKGFNQLLRSNGKEKQQGVRVSKGKGKGRMEASACTEPSFCPAPPCQSPLSIQKSRCPSASPDAGVPLWIGDAEEEPWSCLLLSLLPLF